MKFTIYADPGHAWLKVPLKLLKNLGIENKISGYSYRRKESAYLEEDCDLSVFVNAMKANGKTVDFNEKHTNNRSKIRGYDSYGRETEQ